MHWEWYVISGEAFRISDFQHLINSAKKKYIYCVVEKFPFQSASIKLLFTVNFALLYTITKRKRGQTQLFREDYDQGKLLHWINACSDLYITAIMIRAVSFSMQIVASRRCNAWLPSVCVSNLFVYVVRNRQRWALFPLQLSVYVYILAYLHYHYLNLAYGQFNRITTSLQMSLKFNNVCCGLLWPWRNTRTINGYVSPALHVTPTVQ